MHQGLSRGYPAEGQCPSSTPHDGCAADRHESVPWIVGHHARGPQRFVGSKETIHVAALERIHLQVGEGVDLLVLAVSFSEGALAWVVGCVGAEVVAILPEGLNEVSLDADETATVHVSKDRLVGPHLLCLVDEDKYLIAFVVSDDCVRSPAAIGNQQCESVVGGRESTERLPRLWEKNGSDWE